MPGHRVCQLAAVKRAHRVQIYQLHRAMHGRSALRGGHSPGLLLRHKRGPLNQRRQRLRALDLAQHAGNRELQRLARVLFMRIRPPERAIDFRVRELLGLAQNRIELRARIGRVRANGRKLARRMEKHLRNRFLSRLLGASSRGHHPFQIAFARARRTGQRVEPARRALQIARRAHQNQLLLRAREQHVEYAHFLRSVLAPRALENRGLRKRDSPRAQF